MGGLLARAEQWERWDEGFARLQKKHGFRVWHSKKSRQRKGDFKGWTVEQRSALYWDLAHLNAYGLTEAVAMTLNNSDYENHYRGGPKPNKARFDSKYGLCFRVCLYHFVREVLKRQYKKKVPLLHICGCTVNGSFAAPPVRAIVFRNPAVVAGLPRSVTNTYGDSVFSRRSWRQRSDLRAAQWMNGIDAALGAADRRQVVRNCEDDKSKPIIQLSSTVFLL